MEVELVLGIAAAAIASVSGWNFTSKKAKEKSRKTQEQLIMNEFIQPFLPGVMGFYQLEVLGKDAFAAIDREGMAAAIYEKSLSPGYRLFDAHAALVHMQHLRKAAGANEKELLMFLFWYLDFTNGILGKLLKQPHPLVREARMLQKQYAVWHFCYEELETDAPESIPELIHYSAYFAGAIKEIEMGIFREMMANDELRSDRRGNFVRIIFRALEKEANGQEGLLAIQQFNEHYDKLYTHRNKNNPRF